MKKRIICLIMAVSMMLSMGGFMSNEVKAAEVPMVTDGVIQARGVWHRPNVTGTETNLNLIGCFHIDRSLFFDYLYDSTVFQKRKRKIYFF